MKQKYEHIQLLRALACIGVFITHLAPRLGATGKAAWLANQGAAGVYLSALLRWVGCTLGGRSPFRSPSCFA